MRSVRIATCTSGDPVSSSFVRNSWMSSVFLAAVIDICCSRPLQLWIDNPHGPNRSGLVPGYGDQDPAHPGADRHAVAKPGDP